MSHTLLLRLAMVGAGCMLGHQVASKAVRDAFFLSALPVTDLPKMVMAAAALSMVAVPAFSWLMAQLGPRRLVPLGFAVSAAVHVVEWAVSDGGAWVAVMVYLHVAAFGVLLLSGFWSLATEVFDAHTAKQRFAGIAGAGTLGGIAGGLAVERLGAWSTAETALLALAALHAAGAVAIWALGRAVGPSARAPAVERMDLTQVVRASPYVRDIAWLVVLGTAAAAIVDYLLKSRAVSAFGEGSELLQFFALFYTTTQVLAFLFQTGVVARVQMRLGVGRSVSSLPLGLGAASALALVFPTLTAFTFARGIEYVLRGSLFRSGYELLFAPMAPGERRQVKAFLDVASDRAGDALGAGIVQVLIWSGSTFLVSELLGLTILMAAIAIWIGERLDQRYLRAVERRLIDQADADGLATLSYLEASALQSGEREGIEPIGLDAVSMSPLPRPAPAGGDDLIEQLVVLRSGQKAQVLDALADAAQFDVVHVAQTVRLLAWDDVAVAARQALERTADRHVGLLIDFLLDGATDFAIRRRIPRVLISVPSQRTFDGLLAGLSDARFEVRYQCSRALDRVLVAEPGLRVDPARIFGLVERELSVARPVWSGHRLLDQIESSDALMFLDEQLRDRANRSLEHVFSLLVTVLPREPLKVAFRAIHSEEAMLRGLAFEYLHGVLPPPVRTRLWELIGSDATEPATAGSPQEALDALLRSYESLVVDINRDRSP